MKTYTISNSVPATIIVQRPASGDYDVASCRSIKDAAEQVCSDTIAVAGGEIDEGDAYDQAPGSLADAIARPSKLPAAATAGRSPWASRSNKPTPEPAAQL